MADATTVDPAQQNTQAQMPTTHNVVAGETLSGIGSQYGMNWQDIYNLNKGVVGANPNMIRPGMVLQLPGAQNQNTGNTSSFKLDIPNSIDSSTFKEAMTNPVTEQDLKDAIAKNEELGTKIAGEQGPSANETSLNGQLSDLRAQEDQAKLGLQKYENALPGEGISSSAIHGRSLSMARDVNLDLQTMALQEKNLMARLGIEKATEKTNINSDIAQQKSNQSTISNYESMQRIIDTQKNEIATESSRLQNNARTTLDSILTHLKGYDYQDLSPASQKQVTDLATKSGIPLDIVIKGLSANKSQVQLTTLQKQNAIAKQEQNLGKNGGTPVKSGKATFTSDQIGGLSSALESHKGSDGYVDTSVYMKALENWGKAGGLPKDFYTKFPPKDYLNPNDSSVPSNVKGMLPKGSSSKKQYGS